MSWGQSDFVIIDAKSKTVPDSITNYKEIAAYLTRNLLNETEKARAIYVWIAHNIQYDLSYALKSQDFESNDALIADVLRRGNTICSGYATLFHEMSKTVGLSSFIINGFTKDGGGTVAQEGHVWNGIEIDGSYYLIDVTWSGGYVIPEDNVFIHEFSDTYFMRLPEEFIFDHLPIDPLWQFLNNPISYLDFIEEDYSKLDTIGTFAFQDTIQSYNCLGEIEQLQSVRRRVSMYGDGHKLAQDVLKENREMINTLEYNLAIEEVNRGILLYNTYMSAKARAFKNPDVADGTIQILIRDAGQLVESSLQRFESLRPYDWTWKQGVLESIQEYSELLKLINFEKSVLERYLKVRKPFRIFVNLYPKH